MRFGAVGVPRATEVSSASSRHVDSTHALATQEQTLHPTVVFTCMLMQKHRFICRAAIFLKFVLQLVTGWKSLGILWL